MSFGQLQSSSPNGGRDLEPELTCLPPRLGLFLHIAEIREAHQGRARPTPFVAPLNLASRMKLIGLNQLWVADISYIRLQREFVNLAAEFP